MPLYIRDESVDDLAVRFMKLTGAKSKTEAVRRALLAQIEAETARTPLLQRIAPLLDQADALGPVDTEFSVKDFTDQMWNDA